MNHGIFRKLLEDYLDGKIAQTDENQLFEAIERPEYAELLSEIMDESLKLGKLDQNDFPETFARIHDYVQAHKKDAKLISFVKKPRIWIRYVAAAVFLAAIGTTWFLLNNPSKQTPAIAYKGNVAPGRDGARLKLSDGRIIMIDSIKDGVIAMDGKVKILKQNGKIVYQGSTDEIVYNEIVADKGRQSSAILPDGSVVWLNAASSIRYPLHFAENERLVTMTGEVSFSVVHRASQPFRVNVKGQTIEDIGTEFNINAYDDEPVMKTTVVEGAVKTQNKMLKAGQEAVVNGAEIKIGSADVNMAIAWRKGIFSYKHTGITTVMRQFARWYNVEVRYEGAVPNETFTGDMGRNLNLADALDFLKQMHVHFTIEEDKRIVVMP